jgi:signal transduction histidine kinase
VHILLIDSTEEIKKNLVTNLFSTDASAYSITHLLPRAKKKDVLAAILKAEIVILGHRLTEKSILRLTSLVRMQGSSMPVFVLTKEYDAGIPQRYKKAGVDEMLNINELKTPLLSWTLASSLKVAEVRKKAGEFDLMKNRMTTISETLAFITHEINNPLSIMRLALYHLQTYQMEEDRRKMLIKLLSENIDKVQAQMEELRLVRRQIGGKVMGEGIPLSHKNVLSSVKS